MTPPHARSHVAKARKRAKRRGRRVPRGRRRRGPAWPRWLASRPLRLGLGGALGYVLALNLLVRYVGGGDAFPLSVRYLPEKTLSALHLLAHVPSHLWHGGHGGHAEVTGSVARMAIEQGVPARFALAVAQVESSLRVHAVSHTGAMGVMQLMPATAAQMGVLDPFDPLDNARGATRYLHSLWQRYGGDRQRVAAAYNLGPGRVARTGPLRLPAETRAYVARVMSRSAP